MGQPSHYKNTTPTDSFVTNGEDSSKRWMEVKFRIEQDKTTGEISAIYGSDDTNVTFDGSVTWYVDQDGKMGSGSGTATKSVLTLSTQFGYDSGTISLLTPGTDPWE